MRSALSVNGQARSLSSNAVQNSWVFAKRTMRFTGRVDRVTSGAIQMDWHPEIRLATISFRQETTATGADAIILVDALAAWIGSKGEPFGLLGDGGRLSGLDAEYRSVWGKFLREHRDQAVVAFFNMNAIVRIAAEMFRIGTGLRLKAFGHEHEARAWLRENGILA